MEKEKEASKEEADNKSRDGEVAANIKDEQENNKQKLEDAEQDVETFDDYVIHPYVEYHPEAAILAISLNDVEVN